MPVLQRGEFQVEFADEGSGPPVILLHSSGTGREQWRRLSSQLKHRHRMIAVNMMGYGETSPWPHGRTQSLADQAALVESAADGVAGNISLVGHSFGGAVAMKAALALAHRINRLVLFEPNVFYLLALYEFSAADAEIRAIRDHFRTHGELGDWEAVAANFIDHWNGVGAWAGVRESRRPFILRCMRHAFYEWDAVFDETTPVAAWSALAERATVIIAADTTASIRGVAHILRDNLPGLTYVELPEGGHMAPVTRPELVNPVIIDALEGRAE